MSGFVSGMTLQHLPTDDHSTLAVALVLADQADQEGGKIFPSIAFVAALARQSERQTQYVMRDLQSMGFLVLEARGGGRGNPSRYRIDINWLMQQPNRIAAFRAARESKKQMGAQPAPIKETVHDQGKGAEKVHKGCTKGAQACAPDPYTLLPDFLAAAENKSTQRPIIENGEDAERWNALVAKHGIAAAMRALETTMAAGMRPYVSNIAKRLFAENQHDHSNTVPTQRPNPGRMDDPLGFEADTAFVRDLLAGHGQHVDSECKRIA